MLGEDLVEAEIIGLTKVVRIALENPVSVASVLMLTEATMTACLAPVRSEMPSGLGMPM
jgi:chaperonin GroEL